MFSFVCQAQTDTILKKDSSKFILSPYNFSSFKVPKNDYIHALNYSFEQDMSSRFTLYYDSLYKKLVFYDNYKLEYFFYDSNLSPYNNFKSALIGGSLNYLFLLFDKKK